MLYRDLSIDQLIELTNKILGHQYNHIDIYWYDARPINIKGKIEQIDGREVYFSLDKEVTEEHKKLLDIINLFDYC